MKKLLLALLTLIALMWGAWLIVLPAQLMEQAIQDSLAAVGLSARITDLKKGLWYSASIARMEIAKDGVTLVAIDNAQASVDTLSLFALKARANVSATIGGGLLKGSAWAGLRERGARFALNGSELAALGFLERLDASGNGLINADIDALDSRATLRFSVDPLKLEPVKVEGTVLPLNLFNRAEGSFFFNRGALEIEAVSLKGDGIYARLTGKIDGGRAKLKAELMPEDRVLPDIILAGAIGRYRLAKGHYAVEIDQPLAEVLSGRITPR